MIEARKEYWLNGNTRKEGHYLNGVLHREDGPAIIFYYVNGNIWHEEYWLNGKRHREDGSAIIKYCGAGNLKYKEYHLNHRCLTEQEWFNQLSAESKLKFTFGIK
jgi:hypothetical protein